MIDAHCHLDDPDFAGDLDAVLSRARAAGVDGFVVAGYGPDRWPAQAALAHEPRVWVAFGLHPWCVAKLAEGEIDGALAALGAALDGIDGARPVALGELGLDRSKHVPEGSVALQERIFRAQLALARERDLPLVLHVVKAHGRVLEILAADGIPAAGGMVHAFTGAPALAEQYLARGLHLSFGGHITRPHAERARQALRAVPVGRLLLETDSPDRPLFDGPNSSRNEPANLVHILAAAAKLRGVGPESLGRAADDAARALFRLPQS